MNDTNNPYMPSAEQSSKTEPRKRADRLARFLMTTCGLVLGTIGYVVAAILLESFLNKSEPTLSYEQQAALISTPLCGLIGAMIGLATALVIQRHVFIGTAMLFATGGVGASFVLSLWSCQIS